MKLEDVATASWLAAAVAFGGLALKVLEWSTRTLRAARAGTAAIRKTDADVAAEFRDELRAEMERLRGEVSELRTRAEECEAHSRECREENEKLREHAEDLAERIGQLEARQ